MKPIVCYRIIKKIEDILIKDERFKLPKRTRVFADLEIEAVLVDVTESPIQRPKKNQRDWYGGKKKKHTIKTQAVLNNQPENLNY